MSKLDQQKSKLKTIDDTLKRIEEYVQSYSPGVSINQLKARLSLLDGIRNDFNETQYQIEQLEKGAAEAYEGCRSEFEIRYCDVVCLINDIIEKSLAVSVPSTSLLLNPTDGKNPRDSNDSMQLNLPVLNIKSFSGDYKEWLNFENSFKSVIDENKALNNRQRFQYLKSSLRDEALRTIESLVINDENYKEAWRLLANRFKNTRLIVQDHVMSILNAPSINKQSPSLLRALVDTVVSNLTSLKSLGITVDKWDALLIPIIVEKLDYSTKREWQLSLDKDVPTYKQFIDFLEKRCLMLESLSYMSNNKTSNEGKVYYKQNNYFNKSKTVSHITTNKKQASCSMCKKSSHLIFQCIDFLKMSIPERIAQVKRLKLCINCLRENHQVATCRTSHKCQACNKKHNTLIHTDEADADENSSVTLSNHSSSLLKCSDSVLLSTAVVLIKNAKNEYEICRALLDPGSMSNYITEPMIKKLKLNTEQINIQIKGLNGAASSSQKQVLDVGIKSIYNAYSTKINCIVVNKITENLPLVSINPSSLEIPKTIKLADPKFFESGTIDLLIGAGLFWNLLCIGQLSSPGSGLIFQKTHLGFIVGGPLGTINLPTNFTTCNISISGPDPGLEIQARKIWELEKPVITADYDKNASNEDEILCETHFRETVQRDHDGRFIVRLPINNNKINIGNSRNAALKRFFSLERNLIKNPHVKTNYVDFMLEYQNLNHMEYLSQPPNDNNCVYLPHHAVQKESSTTTKLRVVFDASAKTSNKQSLNDNLLAGAVLQQDLFSIIVRFRTFQYVLNADIAKMYRQIKIHPNDTNYQLVLWRNHPSEPLNTYRLLTLTYGTKPASFIATRCLKELADQNQARYPVASEIIRRDFYMDDLLTGADSIEDLTKIKNDVTAILKQGQFELRKFQSNELISVLSNNDNFHDSNLQLHKDKFTKILGLYWNPTVDNLSYEIILKNIPNKVTKRAILSVTAQIFDPLGLLGPIIMHAKLILQRLWTLKLGWDESVPPDIYTSWITFLSSLKHIRQIKVPRKIIPVAFSDISEMSTLLIRIEACSNSRRLTPLSSDPNDLSILTPGHFLIGEPLTSFPEYDVTEVPINKLSIGGKNSHAFLATLESRVPNANCKWQKQQEHYSRKCTTSHMENRTDHGFYPGDDGVVRVVTIKTVHGLTKRALRKVCVLPIVRDQLTLLMMRTDYYRCYPSRPASRNMLKDAPSRGEVMCGTTRSSRLLGSRRVFGTTPKFIYDRPPGRTSGGRRVTNNPSTGTRRENT
ncbi:uncharacterized protein LOC135128776 [Zophobas morio]|uniref:uncharacterized protein LOC135128776 n=1 Tax=Zophobas morio TaxID=2755281 RepID=UPI003083D0E6